MMGLSKLQAGSWTKAVGIALVCLTSLTVIITIADSVALFYLYSFDRDPQRWTSISKFYAWPKEFFVGQGASEQASLGSLVVRGNNGNPTYASQYELSLADIKSSVLHDCLIAAEDRRFYSHTGLDYQSILKAGFDHFIHGVQLRGASTISNQLMRTVILADESRSGIKGWLRKVAEIVLTTAAERHFSKDDLLVSYVNNVPIGHLNQTALIGFSAAGEALFGKRDPKTLTLSEACALAGMLNRPNRYLLNASKGDYRKIKERPDKVLENLGRTYPERYPETVIQRAKKEEIRFFRNKKMPSPEARQFISYAYQQLPTKRPGLRVYLTVDPSLQRAAEASIKEELGHFDRGPYASYNGQSLRHALKGGLKVTENEAKLQAAFVAIQAKTGEILAMVGGRNSKAEFNRAIQAKRAPGSVIKPFVYLYGINSGFLNGEPFRPETVIDPAKYAVAERYRTGGPARATVQLARSDNGAAVAIAQQFGIERVQQFVSKVIGVSPAASELLAIGAGKGIELSPVEVVTAYTIFPNNGVKVVPNPLWAVYDNETKIRLPQEKQVRVMDAGSPYIVTRMLQSVVGDDPDGQYGTARMARVLSGLDSTVALAGKTGTGDNDLWFVGFTPRLLVVVWVGFDNNFPPFEASKGFTGSGLPLQIWARFMKEVKKYRPELLKGSFEVPKA